MEGVTKALTPCYPKWNPYFGYRLVQIPVALFSFFHFLLNFYFQAWDFRSFGLAFPRFLRSRSTARAKLGLFFDCFCWKYLRYCSQINRSIILFVFHHTEPYAVIRRQVGSIALRDPSLSSKI